MYCQCCCSDKPLPVYSRSLSALRKTETEQENPGFQYGLKWKNLIMVWILNRLWDGLKSKCRAVLVVEHALIGRICSRKPRETILYILKFMLTDKKKPFKQRQNSTLHSGPHAIYNCDKVYIVLRGAECFKRSTLSFVLGLELKSSGYYNSPTRKRWLLPQNPLGLGKLRRKKSASWIRAQAWNWNNVRQVRITVMRLARTTGSGGSTNRHAFHNPVVKCMKTRQRRRCLWWISVNQRLRFRKIWQLFLSWL
jgi:hypothetical protein